MYKMKNDSKLIERLVRNSEGSIGDAQLKNA